MTDVLLLVLCSHIWAQVNSLSTMKQYLYLMHSTHSIICTHRSHGVDQRLCCVQAAGLQCCTASRHLDHENNRRGKNNDLLFPKWRFHVDFVFISIIVHPVGLVCCQCEVESLSARSVCMS